MNTGPQQGFIILADITGFTPFVMHSELEHSNEILHEILTSLVSLLTPTFTLAEVEGDAVFVYAPSDRFRRGEQILEIIESSYAAFRDNKNSFSRMRTCNCQACQLAPTLDLKFIVHYGEYILNDIGGKRKPLGTSINTAHRLLKNGIQEATGWKAYALFTKECLEAINVDTEPYHRRTEHFEHIGTVETFSVDLDALYKNSLTERRAYLGNDHADVVIEWNFPVPPTVLWEWTNDPWKRTRWNPGSDWNIGARPRGRVSRGATNHCVNSNVVEILEDYRPYHYYTSRIGKGFLQFTLTCEFEEIPSGTHLSWRMKLHSFLPRSISRYLCRLLAEKALKTRESFALLNDLVQKEAVTAEVVAA
jgi:hypothetical protein